MGQVQFTGTLQGGPASSAESFPSAQFIAPILLGDNPKSFKSASGILTRQCNDIGTFVELSAIGTGRDVPRANLLYVKCKTNYQLRITQDDGSAGTIVSTMQCKGLFVLELDAKYAIVLAEIAAASEVEYFASGAT